jgi:hypothetical protein
MRRSNYPLRLQVSLMEEARKAAESEGVSLNQLFNVAVAEKLSALRTTKYFCEPIRRTERAESPQILDPPATVNPPMESDELLVGGQPFAAQGKPFGAQGKEAPPTPPPDRAPDGERSGEIGKPGIMATPRFGMLKRRLEKARRF